jgi:hypothetical protein
VAPGTDLEAKPGDTVVLASSATDPDADGVTYRWWQYAEAGTYPGKVRLDAPDAAEIAVQVPRDAVDGATIHLILEVRDTALEPLVSYRRVILTVRSTAS